MKRTEIPDVCPECYTLLRNPDETCPHCGSNQRRRETIDRATMLALVLVCFSLAWVLVTP